MEEVAALLPPGSTAFEFGSGRSTHSLRRTSAGAASIEDSADWLDRTEQLEGSLPKRDSDFSGVVPLTRCWNRLRPIESFNVAAQRESLLRLQQAKLILVDSPPNPAKREHALFLALDQAPAGAVIVLDDLEVSATSRFAHRLARQNADRFRFWLLEIDHQLGVFLKLRAGKMRSRPSFREFVGAWLRA
ncbi:MAG: hypothetical protein DME97_01135 [Verrucomicrobia bacterium]|nr:MAG: hypothetical protein DME97_01135 [Verrucomicrobiota bacterium]